MESNALKLLGAIAVSLVLVARVRWSTPDWKYLLGLAAPALRDCAAWLAIWLIWIGVSEVLIDLLSLEQASRWPEYPFAILVIRMLAIGVAGPFAEELVMRGYLLGRLKTTSLGIFGAVALTSIGWAALHVGYSIGSCILIAMDGVLLAAARLCTRSLWTPILMHCIGNLISIHQSLSVP